MARNRAGVAMRALVERYGVWRVFVNVPALSPGLPVPAIGGGTGTTAR